MLDFDLNFDIKLDKCKTHHQIIFIRQNQR